MRNKKKTEPEEVTDPVTTKSLAKDGGLEEIMKKIEGAGSLEDSLLALGSTDLFPSKTPAAQSSSILKIGQRPTRVSWLTAQGNRTRGGGGGGGRYSPKFRIGVCRERSQTLTLSKDKENEN